MSYKSYDYTCNNTLAKTRNVMIGNIRVNNAFSYRNNVLFESDKIPFLKGYIIIRFIHSWSFHMKFMKLAEGTFHK